MYQLHKIFQQFLFLTMSFGQLSFAFLCVCVSRKVLNHSQCLFDLKNDKEIKMIKRSSCNYDDRLLCFSLLQHQKCHKEHKILIFFNKIESRNMFARNVGRTEQLGSLEDIWSKGGLITRLVSPLTLYQIVLEHKLNFENIQERKFHHFSVRSQFQYFTTFVFTKYLI